MRILIVLKSYRNNSLTKICIKIQAYTVYIPKYIFFSGKLNITKKLALYNMSDTENDSF